MAKLWCPSRSTADLLRKAHPKLYAQCEIYLGPVAAARIVYGVHRGKVI